MIPLMNVSRQYETIHEELDTVIHDVVTSGKYIMGDFLNAHVKSFEKEFSQYIGTEYAVAVANGTDALKIALRALDIGEGDEVITTAMSFFATAEAIALVGAVPVFVDCTNDTYTIDSQKIEDKITDRTRAIIPVHLYGQCADMDNILEIAKRHNLFVIEDAAQAAGAEYKGRKAGSMGDVGCFSFFPTKNLGCAGDAGIIMTNSEDIARKCKAYRVHGSGLEGQYIYNEENGIENKHDIDFHGNLPKYYNFVIGYNSRMDELQAAILRVKLKYLDEWNKKREILAENYDEQLQNPLFKLPQCAENNKHVYYTYVVKVRYRDRFQEYLKYNNISCGVYFPVPLHLQIVFKHLGYKKGDFPNAEDLAEHGIAIPMFAELSLDEQRYVIDTINQYVE